MVSAVDKNNKFSFKPITGDINKGTQERNIPTKLVKPFDNLIVDYLQENLNNCLKKVPSLKTLEKLCFIQPTKGTAKREIKL